MTFACLSRSEQHCGWLALCKLARRFLQHVWLRHRAISRIERPAIVLQVKQNLAQQVNGCVCISLAPWHLQNAHGMGYRGSMAASARARRIFNSRDKEARWRIDAILSFRRLEGENQNSCLRSHVQHLEYPRRLALSTRSPRSAHETPLIPEDPMCIQRIQLVGCPPTGWALRSN